MSIDPTSFAVLSEIVPHAIFLLVASRIFKITFAKLTCHQPPRCFAMPASLMEISEDEEAAPPPRVRRRLRDGQAAASGEASGSAPAAKATGKKTKKAVDKDQQAEEDDE